jgi:hypothetical protein
VQVAGARYYSPGLGRWASRDPIGERGGRSLVAFCSNNCIGRIDLLGLWPGHKPCVPVRLVRDTGWGHSFSIPAGLVVDLLNGSASSTELTLVYTRSVLILYDCRCCYGAGHFEMRLTRYRTQVTDPERRAGDYFWVTALGSGWPPSGVEDIVLAILQGLVVRPWLDNPIDETYAHQRALHFAPSNADFGSLFFDTGVPRIWCWW